MNTHSRRSFLGLVGRAAAGAAAITTVPAVLYEERWVRAAAAQTLAAVEATFIALIETVNDATGEEAAAACGRWVMAEFDKALPPLPEGSPSAAVAAILDAYTVQSGNGPTFATTTDDGRIAALEAMVKDPSRRSSRSPTRCCRSRRSRTGRTPPWANRRAPVGSACRTGTSPGSPDRRTAGSTPTWTACPPVPV